MVQFLLAAVSIGKSKDRGRKGTEELTWANVDHKSRAKQTSLFLALSPAVRASGLSGVV